MATRRYQGTDAWLRERRSGYGSSDVPVLVDGDERSWRELHAVKLGLIPDPEGNETMVLGQLLEDGIAAMAAKKLGEPLVKVNKILRHPELAFVLASLDRRRKRGGKPVELKKWGFRTSDFGKEGSDQVPERIYMQVQQQLAITGHPEADLAVLFAGSRLELFRIGRDVDSIDELLALETENWAFVARGQMPAWPGPAPERPTLRHDEVPVDDVLADLVMRYEAARANAAGIEKELEAAKALIAERLVGAGGARGQLPDGRAVSIAYRPNRDSEKVGWEQIASGYRRRLLELGVPEADLDFTTRALTVVHPGARPLRVTVTAPKEATNAA